MSQLLLVLSSCTIRVLLDSCLALDCSQNWVASGISKVWKYVWNILHRHGKLLFFRPLPNTASGEDILEKVDSLFKKNNSTRISGPVCGPTVHICMWHTSRFLFQSQRSRKTNCHFLCILHINNLTTKRLFLQSYVVVKELYLTQVVTS
jgi:hypothetical protein